MGEQEEGAVHRVAYIGDSLTASGDWEEWFPGEETLNFGVPGYTSDDVLARLDEIVAAQPDEIIMLIGTNDLGLRRSVEHLVRNVEFALVHLRRELPGVRLLLQSIMPRGAEFARDIQDANIHLRQFCATVGAHYLDLWPTMATEDGALRPELTDDGLHLTSAGYDAWLEELRPGIERLRDLPPMSRPLNVVSAEEPRR
ncbi:GDSL-type esterase/lipase family protein [Salinibacterium sp. SYSU T00001]|uniref:GDSL-type esterase/lipase family protein n=1 Tax=Homoserinimonas sedimenticola TaxID=2986805 RepID=UPI002235BD08|nr:GDSL-type esterase/lipase family protein [Salinibacterium sedimenticola]MCW4386726.1 GDSL-type esterase/lipase family protein [Salinibacterium sedimenticola]